MVGPSCAHRRPCNSCRDRYKREESRGAAGQQGKEYLQSADSNQQSATVPFPTVQVAKAQRNGPTKYALPTEVSLRRGWKAFFLPAQKNVAYCLIGWFAVSDPFVPPDAMTTIAATARKIARSRNPAAEIGSISPRVKLLTKCARIATRMLRPFVL